MRYHRKIEGIVLSLYSALVLRERFRALDIASLAAGSAGIALLALAL